MKQSTFFLLTLISCYAEASDQMFETDEHSIEFQLIAEIEKSWLGEEETVAEPSKEPKQKSCGEPVCLSPIQMVLSHNFGRGVGHKGYSSLDFFFLETRTPGFYPFADVRLHVMDDGRFAANGGMGFRRLTWDDNLSIGANIYYDYRNSSHLNTNQISGGIELLNEYADFRLNGYVPVSGKKQRGKLQFTGFSGNQVNVQRHSHYAFPSLNAEFGIPLPWISSEYANRYIAIGPYYLFGSKVGGSRYPNTWGGKFRIEVGITDYVDLKFELNHDKVFKTTCQGVVAINIPLYKKTARVRNCSGSNKEAYSKRVLRPVMRNEIIPIKGKSHKAALTDQEGNIIQAYFVNNLAACPGVGTFESPFCTLGGASVAPAGPVLIYVFEGDSLTTPYSGGFVMKDGQTLQGSGTPLIFHGVTVPAQTTGRPHIFLGVPGNAITMASSTTVQGFDITSPLVAGGIFGIRAMNVSNVQILNNTINFFEYAIVTNDVTGLLQIESNTLLNQNNNGIQSVQSIPIPSNIEIRNNIISDFTGSGILLSLDTPTAIAFIGNNNISASFAQHGVYSTVLQGEAIIASNTFSGNLQRSIQGDSGIQYIQNNIIQNPRVSSIGILYQAGGGLTSKETYIHNNIINMTDPSSSGVVVVAAFDLYAEVINNHVTTANPNNGVTVNTFAGPSNVCASITGNTTGEIHVNGAVGPINLQQTAIEFSSQNQALTFTFGTVNFGSSCTPP